MPFEVTHRDSADVTLFSLLTHRGKMFISTHSDEQDQCQLWVFNASSSS